MSENLLQQPPLLSLDGSEQLYGVKNANDYRLTTELLAEYARQPLRGYLTAMAASGVVEGGFITPTGGVSFTLSAGYGYAKTATDPIKKVEWDAINFSTQFNGHNYLYIDYNGQLVIQNEPNDTSEGIAVGYAFTGAGNTILVGFSTIRGTVLKDIVNSTQQFITKAIGAIVEYGVNLQEQSAPNQLKILVNEGAIWVRNQRFALSSKTNFSKLFSSSDFGFLLDTATAADTVSVGLWNNRSNPAINALVPMTVGYWKKDVVFLTPDGFVFYVYADAEYDTEDGARNAPLPSLPTLITNDVVYVAAIITQSNSTSIANGVVDLRPIFSRLFERGTAATLANTIEHGSLINLNHDDHPQYLNNARGDARYYQQTQVDTLLSGKQDTDILLDQISALTPADDDIIQQKAGVLTNRTPAQLKTDLALTKSDVGLSNVDNTSDLNKPISTATQNALDGKVDVEVGKGLSTNDFTNVYKELADLTQQYLDESTSSGVASGLTITLTGGLNFSVAPGVAYVYDTVNSKRVRVVYAGGNFTTLFGENNFVYLKADGQIEITNVENISDGYVHVGIINTNAVNSAIVGYSSTPRVTLPNFLNRLIRFVRQGIGVRVGSGLVVTEKPAPDLLQVNMSAGTYYVNIDVITVPQTSNFIKLYLASDTGLTVNPASPNVIDTTFYNVFTNPQSTALVELTPGYWKKDVFLVTPTGTLFCVYCPGEYPTQDEALKAPLPPLPETISDGLCFVAAVVTQKGDTTVDGKIYDIRPTKDKLFSDTGFVTSLGISGSHSSLLDLTNDDHLQYFNQARGDARYQLLDADLTALAELAATGLAVRTAADTWATRTIQGTINQIAITNGNAVAGNPVISLENNLIMPGTAGFTMPAGTTAQREASPGLGRMRINTDLGMVEHFINNEWLPLGRIIQTASGTIPLATTTARWVPANAAPTIADGSELWSTTFTPKMTVSKILIINNFFADHTTNNRIIAAAVFAGTQNVGTALASISVTGRPVPVAFTKEYNHTTVDPITLSCRIASNGNGTTYINHQPMATLGGSGASTYQILEILP